MVATVVMVTMVAVVIVEMVTMVTVGILVMVIIVQLNILTLTVLQTFPCVWTSALEQSKQTNNVRRIGETSV